MQEIIVINKNDITGNYLHGFEQEAISFKENKKDIKQIPETWEEMLELLKPYINSQLEYSKPITNITINNIDIDLESKCIHVKDTIFTKNKFNNKCYIVHYIVNASNVDNFGQHSLQYTYITNDINVLYLLILSKLKENIEWH